MNLQQAVQSAVTSYVTFHEGSNLNGYEYYFVYFVFCFYLELLR